MRAFCLSLLLTACAGPPAISCMPGMSAKTFCQGSELWQCTASGGDATLVKVCLLDSAATNPFNCFADHCGPGQKPGEGPACCRTSKPICVAQVDSNPALSFTEYFSGYYEVAWCGIGSAAGGSCHDMDVPVFILQNSDRSLQVNAVLRPSRIMPGQTVDWIALDMGCNSSYAVLMAGGRQCDKWSGSITWKSGLPSFSVSLDLQCTQSGLTDMTLKGTFSGDV